MEVIRKSNPGAYRQPRWHYAADAESTRTICGKDVAEIKGDRRGSWRRGRVERRDETERGYDGICAVCANKVKGGGGSVKLTTSAMKALLARAREAGEKAFADAIPVPMVVYTPKNVMASLTGGDDGGPDPSEPVYNVSEGVCGTAWVNIKPGGSRFARWLVKEGYGRADSYRGGVNLSPGLVCGDRVRYSQSLTRQEAAASAMAEVLREAGIKAYSESWMT
jgi:hypothetical protein